jgi:transposase-like protein
MKAPNTTTDGDDATAQPPESEGSYESLLGALRDLEIKYKLGDVDEVEGYKETGRPIWTFEVDLGKLEQMIGVHKKRLMKENPSWLYKFTAIHAEAKEYFDTADASYRLDLFQEAQRLHRELLKTKIEPEPGEQDSEQRKTIKNKIRVIIAGLEYLHSTSEFGTALAYAQELYDFVYKSGLATKENPAYGTKSVVCYFLGRTHRQRGIDDDYRLAIDFFYQCSENYFELARRQCGNRPEDVIYARTRAMVSLAFGAGFLFHNALSDLARAKGLIAQARLAFLKDDGYPCCELHYGYLGLLYASILREEAGELEQVQAEEGTQAASEQAAAKEKLDRSLEILNECEDTLARKPSYYVRLLYNKALAYLYQGPDSYGAAHECIDRLKDLCEDSPRWLANMLVLRSRLERREGKADAALADAMRAFNQAGGHLPVRIEALLARGKAQQERGNLSGARDDFDRAYRLNNGANKRLEVMALILLAQVAIAQQQPQVAQEKFTQAQAIIPSINHGFILNRFRALEAKISNFQADFIIPSSTRDLKYEDYERALRCWLLEKALREDTNLTRVAQRLGVSKKTVYQWRDAYGVKA